MRLTYTQLWQQFLRNTNQVGSNDANLLADFNTHLGQRYQLMLAKLRNYRTEHYEYYFQTGMNVILLSSGVSQPISTVTSSGTTATITTSSAHGYTTGNSVQITGVQVQNNNNLYGLNNNQYNGTYTITVTGSTTFTYILAKSVNSLPGIPAQYFPYPQGEITVDGMFISVNSVNFPLRIIDATNGWEQLNAILIQASALPQFYFPRRDDFGIWPIPQATYGGTLLYHYRDRNLSISDYSTGTVSLTQYSNQIVGSGTTFTPAMVGRWFSVTDPTVPGQGLWSRITSYVDSTHLNIYNQWQNANASGATYLIGQTPETPEETHIDLVNGVTADFYGGMRKDPVNYEWYSNLFWTGDPGNKSRKEGDSTIAAGLIGAINRYADRDDTRLVKKRPHLNPLQFKAWATSLSS